MRNALTQDKPTLFRDQYGRTVIARTLKELCGKAERSGRVSKQYVDKKDGRTVWCGYVVGSQWFTAFRFAEVEA
jgi:hypothetical protein